MTDGFEKESYLFHRGSSQSRFFLKLCAGKSKRIHVRILRMSALWEFDRISLSWVAILFNQIQIFPVKRYDQCEMRFVYDSVFAHLSVGKFDFVMSHGN